MAHEDTGDGVNMVEMHPDSPGARMDRRDGAQRVLSRLLENYEHARQPRVGQDFSCPQCGKVTYKGHPQKTFCSNVRTHGKKNCKDKFWNRVRGLKQAIEEADD